MSAVYTCDIFCDICPQWVAGDVTTKKMVGIANQARLQAKQAGWVRVVDKVTGKKKDICPNCQKK